MDLSSIGPRQDRFSEHAARLLGSFRRASEDAALHLVAGSKPPQSLESQQRVPPSLSTLAFRARDVRELHHSVSAPAVQQEPIVPLRPSSPTPSTEEDWADPGIPRAAPVRRQDWIWQEEMELNPNPKITDTHVRLIRTGREAGVGPANGAFPQFGDRRPDVSYTVRIDKMSSLFTLGRKILVQMWEVPGDSNAVIISTFAVDRGRDDFGETVASRPNSSAADGDEEEISSTVILEDTTDTESAQSIIYVDSDNPLGGDPTEDMAGPQPTKPSPESADLAMLGPRRHMQPRLPREKGLNLGWRDVNHGTTAWEPLLSSKAVLRYITYTISEDRSGDGATVFRQLLSALATQRIDFPIADTTGEVDDVRGIWVRDKLTVAFHTPKVQITMSLSEPEEGTAEVKFRKTVGLGQTTFPQSLVCVEALEHLGYAYQESDEAFVVPNGLCSSSIEEAIWLSTRYSTGMHAGRRADQVVIVDGWDCFNMFYNKSTGRTVLKAPQVVHPRALKELGYTFSQKEPGTIVIEKPLSATDLNEISTRSYMIKEQDRKYALSST